VEFHRTATGRHLPYGITQCYLPPDTSECAPTNACCIRPHGAQRWADEQEILHGRQTSAVAKLSSFTQSLRGTPVNDCIKLISPETRVCALHFCRRQYMRSSANFRTVFSERAEHKNPLKLSASEEIMVLAPGP